MLKEIKQGVNADTIRQRVLEFFSERRGYMFTESQDHPLIYQFLEWPMQLPFFVFVSTSFPAIEMLRLVKEDPLPDEQKAVFYTNGEKDRIWLYSIFAPTALLKGYEDIHERERKIFDVLPN